jgi:D-sedoheptulose 7-phosphate isomerase
VTPQVASGRVEELLERRTLASAGYFAAEAGRLAELCRAMAESFMAGGRLLAVGGSPQAWSDAHHVAVEFVHPVIVGKRALPALAIAPADLEGVREPGDMTIRFEPLRLEVDGEWLLEPRSDDPFVRQELGETAYHLLWELVHVFFEHLEGSTAGAGASSFLYPFLGQPERGGLGPVVEDVRRSVLMKADEVASLQAQTLREGREALAAAASGVFHALACGGRVLTFGNGGSATDAMDLVADLRAAPQGWPARRAVDLCADPAILTAIANDIGPGAMFTRQLIAYGRPGDVAVALSTSGGSGNIVEALATARGRGLLTVALVGYDGGAIASERLADHVIVSRSEHVPRIQEAQASAYHVLRELLER